MRLSMMPTTKKKLGSIGLFMRQGDGAVGTSSSRAGSAAGSVVGLPVAAPAPAKVSAVAATTPSHATGQLQPPPEIVAAAAPRQERQQHPHHRQSHQKQQQQQQHNQQHHQSASDTPATGTAAAAAATTAPATATASATSRSIPVPRGGRYASGPPASMLNGHSQQQPQPSVAMSLPAHYHGHPVHRTRTSASDTARDAHRAAGHNNAWEDSTVASMFGDNESRGGAASDRLRVPQGGHARHFSDGPPQRALPVPPTRPTQQHTTTQATQQPRHDENLPFVIGENGILKVLPPPTSLKAPEPVSLPVGATPGGIFDDQSIKQDDASSYHEGRQQYETPTKASGLRRTRLAYRDAREPKRSTSSDRGGSVYSPEPGQGARLSPERQAQLAGNIDKIRLQERLARERERQRDLEREKERVRERERERERETQRQLDQERELRQRRSASYDILTPIDLDDLDLDDTKAAVAAPSIASESEALKEAQQRTPRAHRQQQQQQQQQQQLLQPQPLFAPPLGTNPLTEAPPPFNRTGSRRIKSPSKERAPLTTTALTAAALTTAITPAAIQPLPPTTSSSSSRKRRQSLDYNDAELHAMPYSALQTQSFDFDPQTTPLQPAQPTLPPTTAALTTRLEHYLPLGSLDQHAFFAHMTVDEWDEAGDWFLERFGEVVGRLKRARRAKREVAKRFEGEVAAREEAVRGKVEGIERTLVDLRQEGETMMVGRDLDVEI